MQLLDLVVFAISSALIGLLMRGRNRMSLLLALSVWAIFWLQPSSNIKNLGFWLPMVTLGITILSWVFVTPIEKLSWRENWKSALIIVFMVMVWALLPYIKFPKSFEFSPMPVVEQALIGLSIIVLAAGLLSRMHRPILLWVALFIILTIFVIIKTPKLTVAASSFLRGWAGQPTKRALAFDIRWLGFSYIAFRIIHTVRDSQSGEMPIVTLGEYVTFTIFYPALSAGPIDRIERFVGDLRNPSTLSDADWLFAGERLFVGMFKKFVLADGLALFALSTADATSVRSGLWTWIVVYAYSFQIFFDFSGYTDIAIGLGRMVGIHLPENFNRPYLRRNIAQFWNSWHITLAQWFRSYFFYPLALFLRSKKIPNWSTVLLAQLSTMTLIGLWHGVTLNFVIWGLWHGFGLFIHNRWHDFTRVRVTNWASTPLRKNILDISGIFLTFNFVAIGWIFFSMPTISLAGDVLSKLINW